MGADFLQDRVCRSCKDDYVVRAVFSTFLAGTVRNRGSSGRESGPPIRPMSVETRITFFFSLNVKVVGVMKHENTRATRHFFQCCPHDYSTRDVTVLLGRPAIHRTTTTLLRSSSSSSYIYVSTHVHTSKNTTPPASSVVTSCRPGQCWPCRCRRARRSAPPR